MEHYSVEEANPFWFIGTSCAVGYWGWRRGLGGPLGAEALLTEGAGYPDRRPLGR